MKQEYVTEKQLRNAVSNALSLAEQIAASKELEYYLSIKEACIAAISDGDKYIH